MEPIKKIYINWEAFSKAIKTKMKKEKLSLRNLDLITGVDFTRISRVIRLDGGFDAQDFIRLLYWLDKPVSTFVAKRR